MNNLVLDTDVFVDYFRKYEKAEEFFEKLRNSSNIVYFSAMTEAELVSGSECGNFEVKARLLDFMSNFNKIPINNQIAVKAGDFKRIYGAKTPDAIIAATAFVMKADLVTRNVKDYSMVGEVSVKMPY